MSSPAGSSTSFLASVLGCWLGKSIGGTLGLPGEGKMQRLNLTFYDPVPVQAPPNDDLELQLVWLHLLETRRHALTVRDFADAWQSHIHYMWDEYGRCRWNLRRGVPLSAVGTWENPFHASMGSPIRSEIWACLFPGDPASAASYAALDASLDHGTEGIAGEVLFAAMQSLVASGVSLVDAIEASCRFLSDECETAAAVDLVRALHREGRSPWEAREILILKHGQSNFTHAPLNVALTVWALLAGGGDFEHSLLLAVNAGYDTDCTAATAGATLGLGLGADGIPRRWRDPIGDAVLIGPGIQGIRAATTLKELAERTLALVGGIPARSWNPSVLYPDPGPVDLARLPGTIWIEPFGKEAAVAWANGELPESIKAAGGGEWNWDHPVESELAVLVLAPRGASLWVDGRLVHTCPPGLPYVPATHRSPAASRIRLRGLTGRTLRMRVALNFRDPAQAASVILAYPNMHLCPWTSQELPLKANLPPFKKWDTIPQVPV